MSGVQYLTIFLLKVTYILFKPYRKAKLLKVNMCFMTTCLMVGYNHMNISFNLYQRVC